MTHADNKYWIAEVVGNFGSLLSLQWFSKGKASKAFFHDLADQRLPLFYYLGYYDKNKAQFPEMKREPPSAVADAEITDKEYEEFEEKSRTSKSFRGFDQVFERRGLSLSLFKEGTFLKVAHKDDLIKLWYARVLKNVGGRLLLEWLLPKEHQQPSFWLFFCHPRIYSAYYWETKALMLPVLFDSWEKYLVDMKSEMCEADGDLNLISLKLSRAQATRPTILAKNVDIPEGSTVLMFPSNQLKLLPVTVERILEADSSEPLVLIQESKCMLIKGKLTSEEEVSFWFPHDDTNCILPSSWSEENEIPIQASSLKKPLDFKLRTSDRIEEFKSNGRIEVVHPDDPDKICEAVIIRVTPPLIWVQVSLERIHVLPFNSTEMFPQGWCDNNGYPLTKLLPKTITSKNGKREETSRRPTVDDDNSSSLPAELSSVSGGKGWCPRIYFNYKCFTGPSLSKSKLCNLPRFVGPGPVLLVLQEVISKILSIAYVSSRILNDLASEQFADLLEEHKITKIEHVQFKAKYNNSQKTSRLEIPIIRSVDKIEEYCHLMCSHLKCCFNLLGPKLYDGDTCPSNCRGLTKSNRILKRPDFFRQQAITASQYLKGEIEVATFDNIKIDFSTKGTGRGRPKTKRPADLTAPPTAPTAGSNSNSGSENESNKKPRLEESPIVKPKKKKKYKGYKIVGDELIDDTTQSSIQSANGSPNGKENGNKTYFNDPLTWDVSQVYKFLQNSNSAVFASHFKDHVSILIA